MGTITTKTYLRRTFARNLAISMQDGPSGFHTDNEGL